MFSDLLSIEDKNLFCALELSAEWFTDNLFIARMELSARESIESLWKICKLWFWAVDVSGAWKRFLTAWKVLRQWNRAIWVATWTTQRIGKCATAIRDTLKWCALRSILLL